MLNLNNAIAITYIITYMSTKTSSQSMAQCLATIRPMKVDSRHKISKIMWEGGHYSLAIHCQLKTMKERPERLKQIT